jgi:hypothetical protein
MRNLIGFSIIAIAPAIILPVYVAYHLYQGVSAQKTSYP